MFKIFVASIVSFFAVYISDCSHNANKIQEGIVLALGCRLLIGIVIFIPVVT